jgi:hypothetical protein
MTPHWGGGWNRFAKVAFWILLAAPALYQIMLLAWAIGGRFGYPYDLEWMEGGVLHGASRIADGDGHYPPPSVDFIPFLYTPLYPGLVAVLGSVFGLSYQLGRAISVLSLLGIGWTVIAQGLTSSPNQRPAGLAGGLLGLGLFAAGYPFVEGWYDIVRGDTLFLLMITASIYTLTRWANADEGPWAQVRIGSLGAILGLAFFCKQTGVFYVLAAGPVLLAYNWRRMPALVGAAAFVGLGGTWLMLRTTGGWFWTYIYEIHQAHDWNKDRFWKSFDLILLHFRGATMVIVVCMCLVVATYVLRRQLPKPAKAFLLWTYMYAVSTLVGAIGWGTEFAHYNAYMPALLHGAIAAGLAIPTVLACMAELLQSDRVLPDGSADRQRIAATWAAAALCGLIVGRDLIDSRWDPRRFIPTTADRHAGDELVATIRALPGEVWVPSHPWYAHLAGKRMYVHRMGVKDVTVRKPRPIRGLDRAISEHRFDAIVLDNRDLHLELPAIQQFYRPDDLVPRNARPRLFTGAKIVPDSIWVPAGPAERPPGVKVLADFEDQHFEHWTVYGSAWGQGAERTGLPGQGLVRRYGGRYFATSFHGGDVRTGTVISPPFVITGSRITFRIGGGAEDPQLRVELRIDGVAVRSAQPPSPPSERFSDVEWNVQDLRGQTAALALVDDSTVSWGHMNVDEIWLWP